MANPIKTLTLYLLTLIGLYAVNVPLSNANLLALDPVQSGQITADGYLEPFPVFFLDYEYSHQANFEQIVGTLGFAGPNPLHTGPGEAQNIAGYLIFDLSTLDFDPKGGYLEFDLTAQGVLDDLEVWSVDTKTPNELLNLAEGVLPSPQGSELSNDLYGNELYASAPLAAGQSIVQATLNASALSAISGSSDLLAFGVSHFPENDLFSGTVIDINAAPRLVLEGAPVSLPSTAALLLIGFATASSRRRRRSRMQ